MVPVTKTEMVPESRVVDVVEPAAPVTRQEPIFDSVGVVNPTTISARATGPTTPQPAVTSPAVTTTAIASGSKFYVGADASAASRLAKIDPQYVLHGMQEYQRERARITTELENLKKARQAARAQMLTSAQARMKQEQDPVMKEIIDKGMTEKLREMLQEENVDVGSRSGELTRQLLQKIVDEVAGYAKEHHILVVRRERRAGFHGGERFERKGDRLDPPLSLGPSISPVYAPAAASWSPAEGFEPPNSGRREQLWNNDVIYSSDQGSPNEVDISDEILERLNKADAASNRAQKGPDFSFYVGVTR
jgi:Skp family chaperone for outer membrane proteins